MAEKKAQDKSATTKKTCSKQSTLENKSGQISNTSVEKSEMIHGLKLENPDVMQVTEGVDGVKEGMDYSEVVAALATRQMGASKTLKAYSNLGMDGMEMVTVSDINRELHKAGDEAASGDLNRIERMLMKQAINLDAMFNNLAERSSRQEYLASMETYFRLAMKAQSQCRATAETLAQIKNPPVVYAKQANFSSGHQQVNNGIPAHPQAQAGIIESAPNKLLEKTYGERMDIGAQAAPSRANQVMEAVGKVNRAKVAGGQA
jgi:hypothetical protein